MTALAELPSRSSLVEAIKYMLGHWAGLTLFLEDGRIEVDTNTVERTMTADCDEPFILHPFFNYLRTLRFDFGCGDDAGDQRRPGRPQPADHRDLKPGSGEAPPS